MALRSTHTVAELELSQFAYDEIARKFREVGYEHAFGIGTDEGLIDMNGIGVTRADDPKLDRISYSMCEKKARDNYVVAVGFFDLQSAQDFHQWVCLGSSKQSKRKPYAWARTAKGKKEFTFDDREASADATWVPLYREDV